jgi:hypothetical protein
MVEKLTIFSIKTFDYIRCSFNPEQYTVSKVNDWKATEIPGEPVPKLEFGGGKSQELSLTLFFDTSLTGQDVRKETKKLFDMMKPSVKDKKTGKGRPPLVTCVWGRTRLFKAVIKKIDQTFTLFRNDGTPVRADVTATFQQAEEEKLFPAQNPTTMGNPGYKQWLVKDGDTIDSIAFAEYGDSSMWRYIADVNRLYNPSRLRLGQVLVIAPPP